MRNIVGYFLCIWIALDGCTFIDHFNEKPAYIEVNNAYYFLNAQKNDTASLALKDIWVYQYPNIQGIYELPAKFPVLNADSKMYIFQGGVFENGLSAIRRPYPFWKNDTTYLNLSPGLVQQYNPKFHYYSDSVLVFPIAEDFEGVGVKLQHNGNTMDTVSLQLSSTDVYRGQKSATMTFDSTHHQFLQISTQPLTLPTDREVWLEVTLKGDVYLEVGLEYRGTTIERITPFAAYGYPERWNTVFFNLSPLATKNPGTTKYLILKATGDGKERFLRLDNIRMIHAK